jgi:hypothetical protein
MTAHRPLPTERTHGPVPEAPGSDLTRGAAHDAQGPLRAGLAVLEQEQSAYADGSDRPLFGYLAIAAAYAATTAGGVVLVRRSDPKFRGAIPPRDVLFISVATFQLARVITKKPITSFLRAPFTKYEGVSGPAELDESVRGRGVRHALGELLTCPFCMAHWIVTAFGFGYVVAPEVTRLVAAMFTAEAAADFLQFGHAAVARRRQ